MSKEAAPEKKPAGKAKKIIMISVGALVLLGGGVGAGLYAAGSAHGTEEKEDPNRPKLVERSEEHAEEAEGEGGHGGKEAPPKVGTISVVSDTQAVDPKKFEITYYPLEQNFTSNLSDGAGFVQVGLSLSTYYDGKVIANLKRQAVPIRSEILMILSEQDGIALSTLQGKQMLQTRLTKGINRVLREHEGFGGIDNVYFTTLVIQ